MKIQALMLLLIISLLLPSVEGALVVNKYTNDFTLESPNNEQLKVCACGLKTDALVVENVGNFYADYHVQIISPVEDWMRLSEDQFSLAPKHAQEIIVFVETPCGSTGTFDYIVKVTSSYGREEILQRTIRADKCQNIVMDVQPEKYVNNLCQPADYNITIRNVGTYGETYELGFGSFDEYMNISLREFYLKPGQEYQQTATLTLPCTFYGEYDIPFLVYADKNRLEEEQHKHLTVENQFDHSIEVATSQDVCSRVTEYIPFTITNELDVPNEYDIILSGPGFVDVEDKKRTITLDGYESKTLVLEANAQEGQEGLHELTIKVTDKYGKVTKERDVELNVQNCYDFEIEMRDASGSACGMDTLCCGTHTYDLNVRNNGQTTETYNVDVQGPSWFAPEELTVRLNPGENSNVRIIADVPCSDATYTIPVQVVNNRYKAVNETVMFTMNAQTERTCHAVAIDDDEHVITKDTTVIPVVVKHTGSSGGVYDVTMESEVFTPVENQLVIYAGETAVLHLEAKNLTSLDFGRYISMPTLTFKPENNPYAIVTDDIEYVEHLGTQLRDKNIFAKAWGWIQDNITTPGICGWTGIVIAILIIAVLLFLIFGTITAKESSIHLARILLLVAVILVFLLLALIKMPDPAELYVMPDNVEDYFVTIYENGQEVVDLEQYFVDEDGDNLTYVASQPKNVAASIDGSSMTLKPDLGFTGENEIVITAEDGNGGYVDSPVLKLYVLPEKELSFLGVWKRYCLQLNLALLLLLLLLLIIVTFKAEQRITRPKPPRKVARKKTVTKKVARKVAVKTARKKTVAKKTTVQTPVKTASVRKTVPKKAARKMTKAQREKLSKALDNALVSSEPHEMRQVLHTHGKRGTQKNVKILQDELKKFKANKKYKNNREEFYRYLKEQKVLFRLENIKPKKAAVKTASSQTVAKKVATKATRKTTRNVAKKTSVRKTAAKKVAKKQMTPATKANISRTMDAKLVSHQPHELQQVLETHGKDTTARNMDILGKALTEFQKGNYKPKNRERFYKYLKEKNILGRLLNKR